MFQNLCLNNLIQLKRSMRLVVAFITVFAYLNAFILPANADPIKQYSISFEETDVTHKRVAKPIVETHEETQEPAQGWFGWLGNLAHSIFSSESQENKDNEETQAPKRTFSQEQQSFIERLNDLNKHVLSFEETSPETTPDEPLFYPRFVKKSNGWEDKFNYIGLFLRYAKRESKKDIDYFNRVNVAAEESVRNLGKLLEERKGLKKEVKKLFPSNEDREIARRDLNKIGSSITKQKISIQEYAEYYLTEGKERFDEINAAYKEWKSLAVVPDESKFNSAKRTFKRVLSRIGVTLPNWLMEEIHANGLNNSLAEDMEESPIELISYCGTVLKRLTSPMAQKIILILGVTNLPTVASALNIGTQNQKFPSLGEYQEKYSGDGPCVEPLSTKFGSSWDVFGKYGSNIKSCLRWGNDLNTCRHMMDQDKLYKEGIGADFVVFARHPGSEGSAEAVSRIRYGDFGRVCYQSSLNPNDPNAVVTETCYSMEGPPNHHTRVLPGATMAHFIKGLEPGQIAPVVELRNGDTGCALHQIRQNLPVLEQGSPLDESQVVCDYSTPNENGIVQELCFKRSHPESHTLREAPADVSAAFHRVISQGPVDRKDGPRVIVLPRHEAKESMLKMAGLADVKCPFPEGSYRESCPTSLTEPYISPDQRVAGDSCVLVARCNTIIPSIPLQHNEFYYPANSKVRLGNVNGTLTVLDEAGKAANLTTCAPLPGSQELTCQVKVSNYNSTDPNLNSTSFCLMESDCKALDGKQKKQNQVYYSHETVGGSEVAVENCDGTLVIHGNKIDDGSCQTKPEEIRKIAEEKGSQEHVL